MTYCFINAQETTKNGTTMDIYVFVAKDLFNPKNNSWTSSENNPTVQISSILLNPVLR